MDSPTKPSSKMADFQPEAPPGSNDQYGFYQKAEEALAKKKAIEADEDQHEITSGPPNPHHLHSPAVHHGRNAKLESAHGLPMYRQSMPPPPELSLQIPYIPQSRKNNNSFQVYQSRQSSSPDMFGSRSCGQLPQRIVDGGRGAYSQGYEAPPRMYTAPRSPTYDYPQQDQSAWNSGASRARYAPSPGQSMESGTVRESFDSIAGRETECGELEGYGMRDDYEVDAGLHQNEHYRPRTPLQNGDPLIVSRQPVHPSSMPHASRKRPAIPRSYSDNDLVEDPDHGEYFDSPDFTHNLANRNGGPTNYNFGMNPEISPTPGYERKPRVDGSMPPRYPPWRNIGIGRRESRFSGSVQPPPATNTMPRPVPRSSVSDAALLKKGLPVTKSDKCINRAYGANDPENIEIVNLHDHYNLTWSEIAERMNAKRVAEGKTEQLSITAIANRYSRNAPVLMGAAGMTFVPLAKRRKMAKGEMEDYPRIDWSAENDVRLVEIYQAYEAARWETICREFQEETGIEVHPMEVARRYAAIR